MCRVRSSFSQPTNIVTQFLLLYLSIGKGKQAGRQSSSQWQRCGGGRASWLCGEHNRVWWGRMWMGSIKLQCLHLPAFERSDRVWSCQESHHTGGERVCVGKTFFRCAMNGIDKTANRGNWKRNLWNFLPQIVTYFMDSLGSLVHYTIMFLL